MTRPTRKFLEDMVFSMDRITLTVEGISDLEFKYDMEKQDAVMWRLTIIGEAASNIPKELRDKYPAVDWKGVIGMRNLAVHEYFGVEIKDIWDTIVKSLPELRAKINIILERLGTR